MDRREFLKTAAQTGMGLSLAGSSPAAELEELTARTPKGNHMNHQYWVWGDIDRKASEADLKSKYQVLKNHGIQGIFLGGGIDDREFAIVNEAGLELHAWMWTTNRADQWIRDHHPDWYMVSRSGKSCFDKPPYVDYYRWVSPVIPGVQSYLEGKAAELASHPAVAGVHLDYVRYPDVVLPTALWAKYGVDEREELPDYDFCYSDHTREAFKKVSGRDPLQIANPASDQEWLHFRYDSVVQLVKKLGAVARGHQKKLTAAVFPTPRLARKMVRQDWARFPLDAACPMIYHSFYNEGVDWVGDCVLENVQAVTFPIIAGLYMPAFTSPEEFGQALAVVKKRGGFGVSLFGGVRPEYWDVFEKHLSM
jgi:hypothetical protein